MRISVSFLHCLETRFRTFNINRTTKIVMVLFFNMMSLRVCKCKHIFIHNYGNTRIGRLLSSLNRKHNRDISVNDSLYNKRDLSTFTFVNNYKIKTKNVNSRTRYCCYSTNGNVEISTNIMEPSNHKSGNTNKNQIPKVIISLSESYWRSQAHQHAHKIKSLLDSGLLPPASSSSSSSSSSSQSSKRQSKHDNSTINTNQNDNVTTMDDNYDDRISWTALDPKNPIYNFLIEYYGLKGLKGPKRLARWSPDPNLFNNIDNDNNKNTEYMTIYHLDNNGDIISTAPTINTIRSCNNNHQLLSDIITTSNGYGGIFLENAKVDDFNDAILHLRGALPIPKSFSSSTNAELEFHGILYNPFLFYNSLTKQQSTSTETTNKAVTIENNTLLKTIAPFQWYKSILQTTLTSEPVFHCHGLHEWAMVYNPPTSTSPPPSTKYQSHLRFRISQQIINDTIETRGIHCTHVDALRFFAKDAGQYNYHGSSLQRIDQLSLEQKGCVHAHMDLLKIALKLQPFVNCDLICDVVKVALEARRLDVEASPYDVSDYGCDAVPVETEEGRRLYRMRQKQLMEMAEPVRERLLDAYNVFLSLTFDDELLRATITAQSRNNGRKDKIMTEEGLNTSSHEPGNESSYAAPERFAKAEPGGLPWRKNLIESKDLQSK